LSEDTHHPTVDELLEGAIVTLKQIVFPSLTETWPKASAAQLTGALSYARFLLDDTSQNDRAVEAKGTIEGVVAGSEELRAQFADRVKEVGDDEFAILQLASDLLAYAINNDTDGAHAITRGLRPTLRAQLAQEAEQTMPMLMTFGGAPVDA